MQEAERGQLAPGGRHEPLLERDQAQVPQHPVRGRWKRLNVRRGGGSVEEAVREAAERAFAVKSHEIMLLFVSLRGQR